MDLQFICDINLETWTFGFFLVVAQKRQCPQSTCHGDPYGIDYSPLKPLLLERQQFLRGQSPGHVTEVIAKVLFCSDIRNMSACSSFLRFDLSLLLALRHFSHLFIQMAHTSKFKRTVFQTSIFSLCKLCISRLAEAESVLEMPIQKEKGTITTPPTTLLSYVSDLEEKKPHSLNGCEANAWIIA